MSLHVPCDDTWSVRPAFGAIHRLMTDIRNRGKMGRGEPKGVRVSGRAARASARRDQP
jgi:hypothetical protein